MEFNINPEITEKMDAFWSNPYGIAATYVFWTGVVAMIVNTLPDTQLRNFLHHFIIYW